MGIDRRVSGILWISLAAALATWASADISRFLTIAASANTSAVWPPLGIGLAATWLLGKRWIPIHAGLVGVWFFSHGYPPDVCLLFTIEQGGALLLMLLAQRHFVRETDFLTTVRGSLRFYIFVTVVALLPFSGMVSLGYHALGYFPDRPYYGIWLFQWLSEAMGVVLLAPPAQRLLSWLERPWKARYSKMGFTFWLTFLVLVAASAYLAGADRYNFARGVDYLFFPFLIAVALSGQVISVLTMLPIAVGGTIIGVYFGTWPSETAAWGMLGEAMVFSGMLAMMTQLVLAFTFERNATISALREANQHDRLTREFNRQGLIEQVQRASFYSAEASYVCATLCLRNFAHSREFLPRALANTCERWVVQHLKTELGELALAIELARVDKGVYSVVATTSRLDAFYERLFSVVRSIKGRTFSTGGWDYQLEATMGVLPFHNREYIADVLTATLYMASETMQLHGRPLHIGQEYTQLLENHRSELQQLEAFKLALNHDRFMLFGQAIQPLDMQAEKPKMEFLLRMKGSDGNPVSPGAFMPVASQFGYMTDLDRWVIRNAFMEVSHRPELMKQIEQFSINLSGASLSDPGILEYIRLILTRSTLPASRFCFEITETEAVRDWEQALVVLHGVKTLGFSVSLDDFGTGLASFDYLNRFNFDYIKIDGSFVKALDTETRNREVVEAIVLVAQRRGIETVAEFVENQGIIDALSTLNVNYMQGFGLHRPAPLDELSDCVASERLRVRV